MALTKSGFQGDGGAGGGQEPEVGAVEGRTEETAAHGLRGQLFQTSVVFADGDSATQPEVVPPGSQ